MADQATTTDTKAPATQAQPRRAVQPWEQPRVGDPVLAFRPDRWSRDEPCEGVVIGVCKPRADGTPVVNVRVTLNHHTLQQMVFSEVPLYPPIPPGLSEAKWKEENARRSKGTDPKWVEWPVQRGTPQVPKPVKPEQDKR